MLVALAVALLIADCGSPAAKPIQLPTEVAIESQASSEDSSGGVLSVVSVPQQKHLYGNCTITHYCGCAACCGAWGNNTASGARPTAGWTVASNVLPFGTLVEINGHTYCVEDRGDDKMDDFWIDIYCDSHQEALDRGMYSTEVYIID